MEGWVPGRLLEPDLLCMLCSASNNIATVSTRQHDTYGDLQLQKNVITCRKKGK